MPHGLDSGAVSTTDTETTNVSHPVIGSQITTNGTQSDDYTRNAAALSTTDTQTTNTDHTLNTGALTTPAGSSWATAALLEAEPAGSTASAPQIAYDDNGNGFAIWAVTTSSTSVLKAARYTRSTNVWASPVTLYSGATGTAAQASLSVDAAGNAVVAWLAGGAISAARYTGGAWSSAATVVASGATLSPKVSINGSAAAIMWGEGSATTRSAYVSRWNGSAWTTKVTVDSHPSPVSELQVAVDNQGNVIAVWSQNETPATVPCVWTNHYQVSNAAWGGAVSRDELVTAAGTPQIAFDDNGNAFMVYGQDGKTFVVHYSRDLDTWGVADLLDDRSGSVLQTSLSMDATGNAVFAWVQNDTGVNNVYARIYNAAVAAWGPSTLTLENLTTAVTSGSLKTSMSHGFATASWIQSDGTNTNAYAARFNGQSWSAAALLETGSSAASSPAVAIDALGNASAVWIQSNGTSPSVHVNRFSAEVWGSAAALESEPAGSTASVPQIAYDDNGNGFAIWAVTTSSTSVLKAARYTRSTNVWDSPVTLYSGATGTAAQASLSVDSAGNALVAWLAGGAISAARYTSGAWSSAATVVASGATLQPKVSINGSFAAIMWGEGSASTRSAYVSRWNGSAWTTKVTVDSQTSAVSELQVAVDNQGNVIAVWSQILSPFTVPCVWTNRYQASTNSWSGAVSRDELVTAAGTPQIAFDGNGNAFMVYGQEGKTFIIRYERDTNTWGGPDVLEDRGGDVLQTSLSMDAAGNAVFAWVQNETGVNNLYACIYHVATGAWGPSTITLEDLTTAVTSGTLKTAMSGGLATASWIQSDGTSNNAYVAKFNGAAWSAAALLETSSSAASSPSVAIDSLGNASAVWIQSNGTSASVYVNRFSALSGGAPYYSVPAAATWQSIANALYGVDSTAAGAALQTAMGNPALTTGAHLTGWPITLTVTTTTTITVPAYYNVPAGATWQSIANAVYGVNSAAAGSALQTAMGNPTLSTGLHLTGLPPTLSVSTPLAPHYLVPAGATWQSIANTLYGVNSAEAGSALQTVLGNPSIAAGQRLFNIPANLSVSTTSTVTVPAYYTIQSGDTWAAIATLLYGTAAVAAQLQAQQGNPALTPGNRLTSLPTSLSTTTTTTTTTTTVPPYFVVDGNDSWESIAILLYHTGEVAQQLQDFYEDVDLVAGLRLEDLPESFTVGETTTVPITPYYLVQAGQSWEDITLAVYGTDEAKAVEALQEKFPGVSLSAGLHLQVPLHLTYIVEGATGSTLYLRTDITDPLGFIATVEQDTAGRLVSVSSPEVNGKRLEVRYDYDGDGNLTSVIEDPQGLARTTTMEYDARGNLLLTRDDLGNTVTRTWSDSNQLLTETRYVAPDADGAGSAASPGQPLTARFIYDGEDHLRFTVSATGRVTEHRYSGTGERLTTLQYRGALHDVASLAFDAPLSLAALVDWSDAQDLTQLERIDYSYDFRANLETTTTYAATDAAGEGVGSGLVTRFLYDQHGRLLTRIDARDATTPSQSGDFFTSYIYDGLGRQRDVIEWVSPTLQRHSSTEYDDGNRRTIVSLYNGLITTSQFNVFGELVSVSNGALNAPTSLGTTSYSYDDDGRLRMVTNPVGARSFSLYDAAGRQVATVDADGTFSELIYDDTSALVKTIQYAVKLDAATQALLLDAGVPQDVSLEDLRDAADGEPTEDRITRTVYDVAGRAVLLIDADGAVTQRFHDGAGRVTEEVVYATRVSIDRAENALEIDDVTLSSDPTDRVTRHIHDADGNEIATLDSAGYLVEYLRDPAGFLLQQVAYATQTASQFWSAGTLQELRPAASDDDIRSHFFYDAQGRQVGVLDAEGYLTHTVYDEAGNVKSVSRYRDVLEFTAGTSTFASVLADAQAGAAGPHTSAFQYDGIGRVTQQTDFEGTVTRYTYDDANRVTTVTRALGVAADERTTQTRYDELGRVLQELSGEGYEQVALGSMPLQEIWSKYSVTYAYDAAGRRISATVRPNDTQTETTLFFYDEEGRMRYEVNARGEVRENLYDAFGQLSNSFGYVNRISTAGLVGGVIVSALTDRVAAAADAVKDASTTLNYTRRGQLEISETREGAKNTYEYDAFGDNTLRRQEINAESFVLHRYEYDTWGQLTLTEWDPDGLDIIEQRSYDAFGRVVSIIDSRASESTYEYDRLGRQITVTDALLNSSSMTYDAFSRVLTSTDRNGATTQYAYDDGDLSMTVLTPELVEIVTIHNRHGQTLRVTQAGHIVQSRFDDNGNLLETFDNLGSSGTTDYDRANRAIQMTSASGAITTLDYDAANRVLTRTLTSVDDGIELVTEYVYDGQGRLTQVTEPGGRVTQTLYDADGRVTDVIVDPAGLALRTHFQYDLTGRTVDTFEGFETARERHVVTRFDKLGRRTRETVDPTGLSLVTQYEYDAASNLVLKVDAAGNVTRYAYDANSRLRFTVDALFGVSELSYDAAGQVVATRRYATALFDGDYHPPEFELLPLDEVQSLLTPTDRDRVTQSVFDADGQEVFTINSLGGVTQRTFDDNGNVTRTRLLANAIDANATYASVEDVELALGSALDTVGAQDRVTWTTYDVRGRATFVIDGLGAVMRSRYDDANNVTSTTAYATLRDVGAPMTDAALADWSAGAAVAGDAANRTTSYWYDSLDRLRFTRDSEGYLKETQRDDNGRVEQSMAYAHRPAGINGASTIDDLEAAVATLSDSSVDQVSETHRDVAGRITRVYDQLTHDSSGGPVNEGHYEEYGYDAAGNRTSLRNKLGRVWTYDYDANHRLTDEHTPQVAVTTVTSEVPAGSEDDWMLPRPTLESSTETASLVTHIEYDGLGNVVARTEAFGRPEARTTQYVYDALGRQIELIQPWVGTYVPWLDDIYRSIGGGDAFVLTSREEIENPQATGTRTVYDTLGNAVENYKLAYNAETDPSTFSYTDNIYDRLGRLRFRWDAEGFLTELRYDTFGNQTEVIQYSNGPSFYDEEGEEIEFPDVITEEFMSSIVQADPESDRTISTEYDRMNRAVRVTLPEVLAFVPAAGSAVREPFRASPTTVTQYDAFGQAVKVSKLVDPGNGLWADTYEYFDHRGQLTGRVDALGYLTTTKFDAYGNSVETVEFSHALDAGDWSVDGHVAATASSPADPLGADRITRWSYDALNRRTSQTRVDIAYHTATSAGIESHVDDDVTSFEYDALGNLVCTTDANGSRTFAYYDVLGRQRATAAPAKDAGNGSTLIPLVTMKYDAFGNLVEKRAYASGASLATAVDFTATTSDQDRVSQSLFDARDLMLQTEDSAGQSIFYSYDEGGRVGRMWTPLADSALSGFDAADVTVYSYDQLGRQAVTTRIYQDFDSDGHPGFPVEKYAYTDYNAFGEVVSRSDDDELSEHFAYDQAGRVIRSNGGDGVEKVYLYNLAGQATAEIRSATRELPGMTYEAVAALTTDRMRTETRYDLLGRMVEQRAPSFTAAKTDVGLQAIGALLHVDDNVLGPNNPDSVFRITVTSVDYGNGEVHDFENSMLDPGATVSSGGGYRWVPPTSTDPNFGWVQDPNYALVAGRYIHWTAPPDFVYDNAIRSVAAFEIAPASGGTPVTRRVVNLPNARLGVDISDLGPGTYVYRLTYAARNSTENTAIATGTLTIGATLQLTDTTAATLAGENLTATSVVSEQVLNAPFHGANFRLGDFNASTAIDPFVYRRVIVNDQLVYVIDRSITVSGGGGYYRTAAGYVQKSDYTPQGSRLLQWNGTGDPDLYAEFQYKQSGSQFWSSRGIDELPGNVYSVALGDLADGTYEYRVTYRSSSDPDFAIVATASGVFTFEPPSDGDSVLLTQDPPDDAGTVAPLENRPAGAMDITSSIELSAELLTASASGVTFSGDNDVLLTFASIAGNVRVELEYLTAPVDASTDPGPEGHGWPAQTRRISLLVDGSNAAAGVHLTWDDPDAVGNGGGISQVLAVRVYAVDGSGNATLRYSTVAADLADLGGSTIAWKAPWNPDISPQFQIRPVGTATWAELGVTRVAGDFVVDVAGLAPGQWEYQVTYLQDGEIRARSSGMLTTSGGAILNTPESPPGGVYPTDAVAPVTAYATSDIDVTLVSSASQATGTPVAGQPLPATWNSVANQVDLDWASLGAGSVKVVLDYVSAPRYSFNYAPETGWETAPQFLPGVLTSREQTFAAGDTGVSFTWNDTGSQALVGGIVDVRRVRVYTLNGSTWELKLDRDMAAPRAGQTIYWAVPDDPAVSSEFLVRAAGATTWQSRTIVPNGSGLALVDLDDLIAGDYQYQIIQRRDDGGGAEVVALASGAFTVTANAQSHSLVLAQHNVVFDGGAQNFGPVTWDGANLHWSQPPVSGDTVTVRSRVAGTSTWNSQTVGGTGPDFAFALTAGAGEVLEFEVLYVHSGESVAYARAAGVLNSSVAVTRVPAKVSITQSNGIRTDLAPVEGILALNGDVSWETQFVSSGDPLVFRVRTAGGEWRELDTRRTTGASGYAATLVGLEPGEYEFEILYYQFGDGSLRAYASGSVTVGGESSGSGISLLDTTAYSQLVQSNVATDTPTHTQTFDRWGNVIASTDASGNTTEYLYNQSSQMVKMELPQVAVVSTQDGNVVEEFRRPVQYSYFDLLGRMVASKNDNERVTRAVYNAAGEVIEAVDAAGNASASVYDAFGNLVLSTDELGYRTRNTYDTMGRLLTVEKEVQHGGLGSGDSAQAITLINRYDMNGRKFEEVNGAGEVTEYRYHLDGSIFSRTTRHESANRAFETRYWYDMHGNKIFERDANGVVRNYEYDGFGRMVRSEDLDGQKTSYAYGLNGELTEVTSTLGKRQQYSYDEAGHLTKIVDTGKPSSILGGVVGLNRISEYGYDIEGRRVAERTVIDGARAPGFLHHVRCARPHGARHRSGLRRQLFVRRCRQPHAHQCRLLQPHRQGPRFHGVPGHLVHVRRAEPGVDLAGPERERRDRHRHVTGREAHLQRAR